ncbi:hypothetical protein F4820DRAFT_471859 [Hypoxylon rubiginosum]|uniref:Uncharacterized protein n=1 Tax=Hypoxylon rubiginosum TaxID=110542 RepID=A0ACB9YUS2_9PEZI|nr:hypothetical protein F4820DRAFT_471859 [Hypoxylon rubiginosum]
MESNLRILNQTYKGAELAYKLQASWPHRFARTPAERAVCSAASIIRWMKIIIEETEKIDMNPVPRPVNEVLALALADFPIDTDLEAESEITKAIANCAHSLRGNVFDILESPLMAQTLWCKPQYLLFRTAVLEKRNGMIERYQYPVEQHVKDSLIHLENPFELAAAVQAKLGQRYSTERMADQYYLANPPEFIRVYWNNSSSVSQNGNMSIFDALQAFEMPYKEKISGIDRLVLVDMNTGYRLVCVARIPQPGEVAVANHLYHCDGSNFVPGFGDDGSQEWSCQEPGRYYMMYRRSNQARRRQQDGHPAPELSVSLPAGALAMEKIPADWVRDSVQPPAPVPSPPNPPKDAGSVQPPAPGPNSLNRLKDVRSVQPSLPVLNPFDGLKDVRSVQPLAPVCNPFDGRQIQPPAPRNPFDGHKAQPPTPARNPFNGRKVQPPAPRNPFDGQPLVPHNPFDGRKDVRSVQPPAPVLNPFNPPQSLVSVPPRAANSKKRPNNGTQNSRSAHRDGNPFENSPLAMNTSHPSQPLLRMPHQSDSQLSVDPSPRAGGNGRAKGAEAEAEVEVHGTGQHHV